MSPYNGRGSNMRGNDMRGMGDTIKVQGGSLRTWECTSSFVERIQVLLSTEGRPLNANVDLWQGPDNAPQKMSVYIEDGSVRPFNCILETPRGSNAVAIRNTAHMEFPMAASIIEEGPGSGSLPTRRMTPKTEKTIQGGALVTYPFDPTVASVQVYLETDGRPLNARVELLQGPNNVKQVVELYTEDGYDRPFSAIIETPGTGNVLRVVNTATIEFPMTASVEAYEVKQAGDDRDEMGGGWDSGAGQSDFFFSEPRF